MGYLKEKYTEEYYTGISKKGKKLKYGATKLLDDRGSLTLREQDKRILEKVNLKNKNVLALGCGRGEELAYAIKKGALIKNTVGVDFSPAAIKICKSVFMDQKLESPKLFVEDALVFVNNYKKIVKTDGAKKFDIVTMFDFIEHVPRNELSKIMAGLKHITKDCSLIAINTPAYKYDNDVIKDGLDSRNFTLLDLSDELPETKGMHCNKYSTISLQKFMKKNGYINITEAHYFIDSKIAAINFDAMSYSNRWTESIKFNVPLVGEYSDDVLEYPYNDLDDLELFKFKNGNLKDISIITTKNYVNAAYPNGSTDSEMMENIKNAKPIGKVIFDVGTYIGTSAMLFSKIVGKEGIVIGFEPNPANRNRAFINLSHNQKYKDNILVFDCALGDNIGKRNMLLSTNIDLGYSSTSRLKGSHSNVHDSDLPEGFEEYEVISTTLDLFIKKYQVIPSIIKLDIEGAEYEFLLGAIESIKNFHPIFYIELHSQYCTLKCTELLLLLGYSSEILHEEENNRIIVKFEYQKKKTGTMDNSTIKLAKSLNNAHKTIRQLQDETKKLSQRSYDNIQARLEILEERAELITQRDNALNKINEVFCSKSWRITRPLRSISATLKSKR